jgi:hypothetical protein
LKPGEKGRRVVTSPVPPRIEDVLRRHGFTEHHGNLGPIEGQGWEIVTTDEAAVHAVRQGVLREYRIQYQTHPAEGS